MEEQKIGNYLFKTSPDYLLGQGAFGSVYRCWRIGAQRKDEYCVKIIQKEIGQNFQKKAVQQEIDILEKLKQQNYSNLVQVYDIYDEKDVIYIIMEMCDYDLYREFRELQREGKWYQEQDQIEIIQQITRGCEQLYQMKIIHRDIKPQNILVKTINRKTVNEQKIYKISDFGFSKILNNLQERGNLTRVGTPSYVAPQLYFDSTFSGKCDIFSYGVVFYQLCFKGKYPYDGKGNSSLKNFLRALETQPLKCTIKEGKYKDGLKDLLEKMIVYSEEKRITFEDLFQHPILQLNIENTAQDSLFIQFQVKMDQQKIMEANAYQLKKKLNSRLKRINQILTIFSRKYELFKYCINQLDNLQKQNVHIKMAVFCLYELSLLQLTYAMGIINANIADIHISFRENVDIPHLIESLQECNNAVKNEEFYQYKKQRESISSQYFIWRKQTTQFCDNFQVQLTLLVESSMELKITEYREFFDIVKSRRVNEMKFYDLIQEIIANQNTNFSQQQHLLLNKICNIEKDFPIKEYRDLNPDAIYVGKILIQEV